MGIRIEFCAPLGAGKSTFAKAIADYYGWTLVEEPADNHPFLADFYKDHEKYGFDKDAFFALAYINNVKKFSSQNTLFDAGNLLNQSYNTLMPVTDAEKAAINSLYVLTDALPKPDLLIYLEYPSKKILERVRQRGRDIEKDVSESYIQDLQHEIIRRLDDPANTTLVLKLDMEEFDLIKRPEDIKKIAGLIEKKIGIRADDAALEK